MRIRRTITGLILSAATGAAPGSMGAQAAAPQPDATAATAAVQLPDTPLGALAGQLIDLINRGDSAAQVSFLTRHLAEAAIEEQPVAGWAAWLMTIHRQSGGVDVRELEPQANPLAVIVQTRRGGHWGRIFLFGTPDRADQIRGIGTVPLPDIAARRADPWPERKLSESELVAEIDRRARAAVARDEFSGVILVAKDDRILYQRAFGEADKNFAVPNTLTTKFNLASVNKMFTSVAIAQLVAEGRLRYEDTLAKVVPEYPNSEAAAKITIHQLLTHQAGLGGLFDRPGFDRRKRYRTSFDNFPAFAAEPLLYEPGTGAWYSNESFVVLGAVIEKLTGRNYFDHVRDRIFKPLGMDSTESYALDDVVPNLAVGYARFDDPLGVNPRRPNHIFLQWKGSAAGGGYSTAPDLFRFARAFRGYRLLSPELTERMVTPKDGLGNYGYGVQAWTMGGQPVRGHGGGGPGSGINARLGILWNLGYTVVVLANYDVPAATDMFEGITRALAAQAETGGASK